MDRAIPANIDAERSTLGAILLERDAILPLAPWMRPEMFYLEKHAWIYEAALACATKRVPPDISTVADELRRRERLDLVGGISFLDDLRVGVPTAIHVEYYARIVERTYMLRSLIEAGGSITALGYDESRELDVILRQAHEKLSPLQDRSSVPHGIPAPDLLRMHVEPVRWIIPDLVSTGFGYLAGKSGTGKTWLLLEWAVAVASGGRVFGEIAVPQAPVLFLALEDTAASLQERLRKVCNDGPPPVDLIFYTEDAGWKRLDEGGYEQLEQSIQAIQPGLVVVDTLTALAPVGERHGNAYVNTYQGYVPVRHLANQYDVAILGSWHFNKDSFRKSIMEMVNGDSGIPAVSVNRIGMVRDEGSDTARLRSDSKRGPTQDWLLKWDPQLCQWRKLGDTFAVQTSDERQKILDYLSEQSEPASVREVSDALEKPYNSIMQLLKRMCADGHVVKAARGKYRLPDESDRPDPESDRSDPGGDHFLLGAPMPESGKSDHVIADSKVIAPPSPGSHDHFSGFAASTGDPKSDPTRITFEEPITFEGLPDHFLAPLEEARSWVSEGHNTAARMIAARFAGAEQHQFADLVERLIIEHGGQTTLL